jgi:hypothetical protein
MSVTLVISSTGIATAYAGQGRVCHDEPGAVENAFGGVFEGSVLVPPTAMRVSMALWKRRGGAQNIRPHLPIVKERRLVALTFNT